MLREMDDTEVGPVCNRLGDFELQDDDHPAILKKAESADFWYDSWRILVSLGPWIEKDLQLKS